MKGLTAALAAVLMLLGISDGIASAHASLVSSNIKNYQTFKYGHAPKSIVGHFAEQLDPGKSWMAVFEGVADHGLVTEKQHSVVNFKTPTVMTLALPKNLAKDKYYLIWYTRSAVDGHYACGIVYFQVK